MPVADSSFGLKIGFEGVLKASLAAEAVVDGVKATGHAISYIGRGMGRVGQMMNVGASLVSGLWQGIQSLAGWLWNRVSNWVSSIWNGILGFFGIHSPSKQMAWVARQCFYG